jgi:hypothetical protein
MTWMKLQAIRLAEHTDIFYCVCMLLLLQAVETVAKLVKFVYHTTTNKVSTYTAS